MNSALNGHGNAALSSLATMPALYLVDMIVHVVYRNDLIHHGMTPVLHWDISRMKIRSQNVNPETQNSIMVKHMNRCVCIHTLEP